MSLSSPFTARTCLALLSTWVLLACGGAEPAHLTPEVSSPSVHALSLPSEHTAFSGTTDANGRSWITHTFTVSGSGRLEATLDWDDAAADLNLFVSRDGETLAFSNKADKPELVSLELEEGGTYTVALKCKQGSAAYTIDLRFTPDVQTERIVGQTSATHQSWQTFDVELLAAGQLEVTLDWEDAEADLNLFVSKDGETLAFSNKAHKPEVVSLAIPEAGHYTVALKCKQGETDFTLDLRLTPAADTEPPVTADYPGKPAPGTVIWGAAVQGNADPFERHEAPAGAPLGVRRTFYQWHQRTGWMINTARADLAAGRLPWVSVKTPSWADMAAGHHDAEIDEMLLALEALGGPIWLTVHHEPEGGGGNNFPDDPAGPAGHLAMNRRVRERMTALGTQNIALSNILMSYTWTSQSGRDPDVWWEDGIFDFLGVDHYRDAEATLLNPTWAAIRQWAAARNVDVAVGEWGLRGTSEASGGFVRDWYEAAIQSADDGQGARVVGLSAFDSNLNSPNGGWELKGAQLEVFQELLSDPRSARIDGN